MAKQLEFKKVKGWGGKRRGAGRPNRTDQVSHGKRESVDFKKPLHITLKLKRGLSGLRTSRMLKDFKNAIKEAKRFSLHVIHFSLQNDHIHFIAEAKDSKSLSRGMKSLSGRLGKAIRRVKGGRGRVFNGRFHMHVLKSPTEMKRTLEYVLLNTVKHLRSVAHIDAFSSGFAFKGWRKLLGRRFSDIFERQLKFLRQEMEELSLPRSWIGSVGWMKAKG